MKMNFDDTQLSVSRWSKERESFGRTATARINTLLESVKVWLTY